MGIHLTARDSLSPIHMGIAGNKFLLRFHH